MTGPWTAQQLIGAIRRDIVEADESLRNYPADAHDYLRTALARLETLSDTIAEQQQTQPPPKKRTA